MDGTLEIADNTKDKMVARAIRRLAIIINSNGLDAVDETFTYSPRYDLNVWELERGEDDEFITWGITAYLYKGDVPPTEADFVRLATLTLRKESE